MTTLDKIIDKQKIKPMVEEIMQLGFDVAMGGDVFKSEEFNRLQQERNYDKVVKKYSREIGQAIRQSVEETLDELKTILWKNYRDEPEEGEPFNSGLDLAIFKDVS